MIETTVQNAHNGQVRMREYYVEAEPAGFYVLELSGDAIQHFPSSTVTFPFTTKVFSNVPFSLAGAVLDVRAVGNKPLVVEREGE